MSRRFTHPAAMFLAGAATVLAIVAVLGFVPQGSKTTTTGKKTGERAASAPAQPPALRVRRTRLGPILTDAQGRTLYLFTEDKDGRSHCFGTCAQVWPPVLVSGTPRPGPGIIARKLSTTKRGRSKRQLVYNGHPLYRMDADARPGDMEGEGFLGTWWVVSPQGKLVVAPGTKVSGGGGY